MKVSLQADDRPLEPSRLAARLASAIARARRTALEARLRRTAKDEEQEP